MMQKRAMNIALTHRIVAILHQNFAFSHRLGVEWAQLRKLKNAMRKRNQYVVGMWSSEPLFY